MKSLTLEYCWVCNVRFNDVVNPGAANREEHHIIPRQAGGTHGPTVSLCDKHHTILHKIAVTLNSKNPKPYQQLISDLETEAQSKILYLAGTAANAFAATKNDPNKKRVVVITLDQRIEAVLNGLKTIYPKARGREDLIKIALIELFNRHFQQR